MATFRIRLLVIGLVLTVLASSALVSPLAAQTPVENQLSPATLTGIPPYTTREGVREQVNLANGDVSVFIPLITIPMRTGRSFTLGLPLDSHNTYTLQEYTQATANQSPYDGYAQLTVNVQWVLSPLVQQRMNIPQLTATRNYMGAFQAQTTGTTLMYCTTNWVFTDENGTSHQFNASRDCTEASPGGPSGQIPFYTEYEMNPMDTSPMLLNVSNPNDLVVYAKDGTQYHFTTPLNTSGQNQMTALGQYWYTSMLSRIQDRNGNTLLTISGTSPITISNGLGRTITLSSAGILDSNGQTITITSTPSGSGTWTMNPTSCNRLDTSNPWGQTVPIFNSTNMVSGLGQQISIVRDGGLQYSIQLDTLGGISKITYPGGGYTSFDYQTLSSTYAMGIAQCTADYREVVKKHVCTLSNGGCSASTEAITTYSPLPVYNGSNLSTDVVDPLGNRTHVAFDGIAYGENAPLECLRQIYSGQSTLLRTVQTQYANTGNYTSLALPIQVTTTLNDVSPSISSTKLYQYEVPDYGCLAPPVTCVSNPNPPSTGSNTGYLVDNPTEIDEYDYDGTLKRKTTTVWQRGGNFQTTTGHILDRPSSNTVTDPISGAQSVTTYSYDANGNPLTITRSGTGVSGLATQYAWDSYGNLTQVTDPKGNVTKYGYTDSWADSGCVPSPTTYGLLTSVTNALNQATSYTNYSCSGLEATTKDPNGQVTTFHYDDHDRLTEADYPDGGYTKNAIMDSSPQSVTTTQLIDTSTGRTKSTEVLLDGLSRKMQTQLTSDPQGTVYVDTGYDALERQFCDSNPYRTASDSTYGITTRQYDALGRITALQPPDYWTVNPSSSPSCQSASSATPANPNSFVLTSYLGNATTVTDQAGTQRRSFTDALGRLTEVDEPGQNTVTPGTQSTGSVTIGGSLQSKPGTPATKATGTITFTSLMSNTQSVQVGTYVANLNIPLAYGTTTMLAQGVAAALNYSSIVSASSSGSTVYLTSTAAGTAGNYSIYVSGAMAYIQGMSGGTNSTPTTYDHGTVSVTVNGSDMQSVSYGQGDTPSTIVTKFVSAFSGDALVTATGSGSVLTLTSVAIGISTNYSLSTSVAYDTTDFSSASFTATRSGSAMTGGTNATLGSFSLSTVYTTLYTYDAFGNLLSVNQKGGSSNSGMWHTRTFTYDGLSRLLTSSNPESGTISYSYDADSNLSTKTDARGVLITYTYDSLNRLTQKTYQNDPANTPTVKYGYDGLAGTVNCPAGLTPTNPVDRRTSMCDAAGTESWSYDVMGRVLTDQRTTNNVTKNTYYTYLPYVDGSIYKLQYPSGNTFTYTTDSAGRPSVAVDSSNIYAYGTCANGISTNGVCYAPPGGTAQIQNGPNLYSTFIYNNRLQPCWIYATTGTPLAASTLCTAADSTPGNILDLQYNFNLGSGDNGNVMGITNNHVPSRSQTFAYDALNRIATAGTVNTSGTSCWGEAYGIDPWGNLTSLALPSPYASSCSYETPFNYGMSVKNQIATIVQSGGTVSPAGFLYDAAGNLTQTGWGSYVYNAESQMKQAGTGATATTYVYDGDGNRVEKIANGTATKLYWSSGGNTLDETDGTGSTVSTNSNFNEYVFFGGKRIARLNSGAVYYYVEDNLGTSREIVQSGQTSACYDADFYPFGGEMSYTSTCSQNYKFTGKERDSLAENGNLDNFSARFYGSSSFGRFMSADWSAVPEPVPFADLGNPQSLNLYAYVLNNPVNRVDGGGHAGKEPLPGTSYTILKHRDNPNDMPNIHVYDKKGNEVGQLRFNKEGQGSWEMTKPLGSEIRQQVERIARDEGFAAKAIERQAAMSATRAARGGRAGGTLSEALSVLVFADVIVNAMYQYETEKKEGTTGWHYDAIYDQVVVTDVDKAAKSLPIGSQVITEDHDVYTLGSDGKWRDSRGYVLFGCSWGICSTGWTL